MEQNKVRYSFGNVSMNPVANINVLKNKTERIKRSVFLLRQAEISNNVVHFV